MMIRDADDASGPAARANKGSAGAVEANAATAGGEDAKRLVRDEYERVVEALRSQAVADLENIEAATALA